MCGKMCWSVDVNRDASAAPASANSSRPSTTTLLFACLCPLSFIRPSIYRPHPSSCSQHIAAILGKKDIAIMLLMHHVRYKRMAPRHTYEIDDRQKDIASKHIMAHVRVMPAQSR